MAPGGKCGTAVKVVDDGFVRMVRERERGKAWSLIVLICVLYLMVRVVTWKRGFWGHRGGSEGLTERLVKRMSKSAAAEGLSRDELAKLEAMRENMLRLHLSGRDIRNPEVLRVMGKVPRHEFVPKQLIWSAYGDHPLPLDRKATISQPYIVALMTQLAEPKRKQRALDVGTGSGYQAAILAEMVSEVYSIEIASTLAASAAERLRNLGYDNVHVKQGNGYAGWVEHAPYDIIVVAACPADVPHALVEQLAPGGRLVIPVGRYQQHLDVVRKNEDGTVTQETYCDVNFVPLVHTDPSAKP